LTQALSTLLTAVGVTLVAFSTWQYTVDPPSCCYNNYTSRMDNDYLEQSYNWSTNCSEIHKLTILDQINLQISPTINMAIAIIGLIVSSIIYMQPYYLIIFFATAFFNRIRAH